MSGSQDASDPDLPDQWSGSRRRGRLPAPPGVLALIVVAGACGTLVRALIEDAVPPGPSGWPWATFAVNVSGAFVLGVLLEVLVRLGPDSGWRRRVRLTVGTGFFGGYTTYSTFAVEVVDLTRSAPHLLGLGYGVLSVALGGGAAAAGYLLATGLGGRTSSRDEGR